MSSFNSTSMSSMMGITMKAELAPAGMVKDNDCRPSVKSAGRAAAAQELGAIDLVLIATGLLHDDDMKPEKTWRSLEPAAMMRAFEIKAFDVLDSTPLADVISRLQEVEGADWGDDPIGDLARLRRDEALN